MSNEDLADIIDDLKEKTQEGKIEWTKTASTLFETKVEDKTIIVDRRNNISSGNLECVFVYEDKRYEFLKSSEEFNIISDFVDYLK